MPLPFKSYAPSPMKSASPQVAEMTFTPITVTAAAKENMVLSPTSNRNLAAIVSRVAPLAEIVLPGGDDGTNLPAAAFQPEHVPQQPPEQVVDPILTLSGANVS